MCFFPFLLSCALLIHMLLLTLHHNQQQKPDMAKIIDKYVWLMDTVRKAGDYGITFEDINKAWMRKDNQHLNEGVYLIKRTFHKWRLAIRQQFNIEIECKRTGGYRYYISNPENFHGHDLSNWLIDTISVSQLLMHNIALKDRILLENVPSGLHYLPLVLEAMNDNRVITITYQGYWHESPNTLDIHPYCVKLFKQRWYMIAYSTMRQGIRTYSMDRIHGIEQKEARFEMPENFSPTAFFKNAYGVMMGSKMPCDIKIRVKSFQANYLRSLPLHHSQQETVKSMNFSIFTYHLCPEFDFQMELLSMGDEVEVLEPASLRESMATIACNMNGIYSGTSPED